ncbi:hypothetical protein VNO77_05430 [Canavalia gladiata]|uniref:Uncharacterized protein n=1 Tax=Canavalia gladiata TaxID=3824 RepID=A0AAN9N417_CANGL
MVGDAQAHNVLLLEEAAALSAWAVACLCGTSRLENIFSVVHLAACLYCFKVELMCEWILCGFITVFMLEGSFCYSSIASIFKMKILYESLTWSLLLQLQNYASPEVEMQQLKCRVSECLVRGGYSWWEHSVSLIHPNRS